MSAQNKKERFTKNINLLLIISVILGILLVLLKVITMDRKSWLNGDIKKTIENLSVSSKHVQFGRSVEDAVGKLEELPEAEVQLTADGEFDVNQIVNTYKIGNYYVGLVANRNANLELDVSDDFEIKFSGIVYAKEGETKWTKLYNIKNAWENNTNSPYAMWVSDSYLFLTVVDDQGNGGGEGILKLMKTKDAVNWEKAGCYYFSGYQDPDIDGDYFNYSKNVSQFARVPESNPSCENFELQLVN